MAFYKYIYPMAFYQYIPWLSINISLDKVSFSTESQFFNTLLTQINSTNQNTIFYKISF